MRGKERAWEAGLEGAGLGAGPWSLAGAFLGGAFPGGVREPRKSWRVGLWPRLADSEGGLWTPRLLMKEVERKLGTWQDFQGRTLSG